MPLCQVSQIARIARISSRMRGAGWLHSIENRLVMCGLIWLPRPRMNRPLENACRSQPMLASVIGLRANATAIDVPSSSCSVCSAAEQQAGRTDRGPSRRSTLRRSRRLRPPGAGAGLGEIVCRVLRRPSSADRKRRAALGQSGLAVSPGRAGTARTRRRARRRSASRGACRARSVLLLRRAS